MLPTLATLFLALQETAPPTGSEGGNGGGSGMWLPLVAMGAIFYFLLIAPERKQRKQRQAMLDAIQKDDRVMTTGGIRGRVAKVEDAWVTLQVSDGVRMTFSRQAVQAVLDDDYNVIGAAPAKKD